MSQERPQREVNRKLISLARESRALTQAALAKAVGVPQGKLSKVENGQSIPEPELLRSLANSLGYVDDLFYQDISGLEGYLSFNRMRKTTSVKARTKVRSQLAIKRIQVERLLSSIDVESHESYLIPNLDVDDFNGRPELVASALRVQWGIPSGPVDNLTRLVERGDGLVLSCNFEKIKIDAEVHICPRLPIFLFFINSASPGDRLRYSLAHELGHAVMHRTMHPDVESQADRFAAEFLMPESDIKYDLNKRLSIERLADLKRKWGVSMAALLFRAKTLGSISDGSASYLWRQMSALGYRTREPWQLDTKVEKGTKLADFLRLHIDELEYTYDELAELLFISPEELATDFLPLLGDRRALFAVK